MTTGQAPPGWYPDPTDGAPRYWDGTRWTQHRAPAAQRPQPQQPGWAPPQQVQQPWPQQQPWTPPAAKRNPLSKAEQIWACGAFAATIVGSIGPWATLGVFSKPGTDGDGVLTIIAAVLGVILGLALPRGGRIAIGVVGALILLIGIIDMVDVSSSGSEFFGEEISPSIGWGLWVVTLSGAAAVLCSVASRIGIVKKPA